MIGKSLMGAALVALSTSALAAQPASAPRAASGDVLWFADAYATAWYWLDGDTHEVVTWIDPGAKGGNRVLTRRFVAEGSPERISISGADANRIRATLVVSRSADGLKADVVTELLRDDQASN